MSIHKYALEGKKGGGGGGGGEGGALWSAVYPMREQRIVKHTLNSVIGILNLTPLFTVFSLKCVQSESTLSSVVN